MYAIAESIHPESYWKLGEKLDYTKAKLEQWKREHNKSILEATYSMLYDRLGNMSDTQWMNKLMTACDQCGLKKISLHLKEGHVFAPPPPHKKNFQKSDHVLYNGTIGNIPIVADMTTVAQGISPSVDPSHGAQLWFNITTSVSLFVHCHDCANMELHGAKKQ